MPVSVRAVLSLVPGAELVKFKESESTRTGSYHSHGIAIHYGDF